MESRTILYRDFAKNETVTIPQAVAFLEQEAIPRSFQEIVERFCHSDNSRQCLINALKERYPNLAKGSVERRVRGWYQGKHLFRRSDAIELCFLLGLSLEEADDFVAMFSEERLHWRDPEEICYIFSLLRGYSYEEACALWKEAELIFDKGELRTSPSEENLTSFIHDELLELSGKTELLQYLRENCDRLGALHNNAFLLFNDRLDCLKHPNRDSNLDDDTESMTIRDIIKEYMYGATISYVKERAKKTQKGLLTSDETLILSMVQKSVSENWPDETTISKILHRKEDVTRKALILLLLATEEGFNEADHIWYDGELDYYMGEDLEPSREERFEDICGRLNQTLNDCGFSALDPRSPFDWIILYSLCVEDMLEADEKMKGLFRQMFGEAASQEGN